MHTISGLAQSERVARVRSYCTGTPQAPGRRNGLARVSWEGCMAVKLLEYKLLYFVSQEMQKAALKWGCRE